MAKFKFEEEQTTTNDHTCETCELLDEMFDYIFNVADNRNEVIEFLVDYTYRIKQLGYEDAMKEIILYGVNSIRDLGYNCKDECDC